MIIVCRDPANVLGSERYIQDVDSSWKENLFRIFSDGLDDRDWKLKFNGTDIECKDLDLSAKPDAKDVLIMQHRPKIEGVSIWLIAGIAAAAALAVTMLMPSYDLGSQTSGKTSSNNSFTGQTNLPRAYQAQPDHFGRNRIYPDIFSPSVVEYVDNVKTLRHYFWGGRGSHQITDVKYADSDVTNYANSAYNIYGPNVAIPEVIEQFANEAVDGQELLGANESSLSGISVTDTATNGTFTYSTRTVSVNIPYSSAASLVYDEFVAGNSHVKTTFTTVAGTSDPISYNTDGTITSFDINYDLLSNPESYDVNIVVSAKPTYSVETLTGSIYIETYESTLIGPYKLSVSCKYIWADIVFLRGLKGTATLKAEWWAVDGNGDQIAGSYQYEDFSYSGDTLDQKYFTRKWSPVFEDGDYEFQIRRTNNADTENATNQAKLNALYAIRIKENVTYAINGIGGTAIVVDSSATENATTSSGMKFNYIDQRLVITCNADGTINSTLSASRRVCDIVAHHMHIDGRVPLSKIDIAGIYAIQQSITPVNLGYFDFSFDDADVSLGDRVKAMCNVSRILVNREGSKWAFIRDQSQPAPVATFDRRTTANEDFTLTWSPTNNDGKDSIELQWVDIDDSNTKKYLRLKWDNTNNVPMFGYGYNPYKITLDGCTNYEQALDRAELEMRKIVYQRKSVSDVALNDAEYTWRGDRVRWIDVADVSVGSGEVLAASGTNYKTSDECEFEAGIPYKVCITDSQGYASEFVTATARTDGINGFVASGLPVAQIKNYDNIQLGSRYFLVKSTEVDRHDFILTSKTPNGDGTFNIDLAQYDERIYLKTLS